MLYFVITKQKWRQHMILHNYLSNSGRDLIYEYINSLPEAEKIDGYTVLQHMEKGEFVKDGKRKCMRYIFRKITVYSILQ